MAEREWAPSQRAKAELLDEARTVFGEGIARIRTLEDAALDERRPVGRRRVLGRRAVILHHLGEHAAHHVGQIRLLARVWSARAHPAAEAA